MIKDQFSLPALNTCSVVHLNSPSSNQSIVRNCSLSYAYYQFNHTVHESKFVCHSNTIYRNLNQYLKIYCHECNVYIYKNPCINTILINIFINFSLTVFCIIQNNNSKPRKLNLGPIILKGAKIQIHIESENNFTTLVKFDKVQIIPNTQKSRLHDKEDIRGKISSYLLLIYSHL